MIVLIKKSKAFKLAILALFIAFVIVQNYIPMFGYIPIGALSITTIQITVIISAIVLGPTQGGIVGAVWGILSCIKAFTAPTSPVESLIFTHPIISVIPRILVGVITGVLFMFFIKKNMNKTVSTALLGCIGALINTILVLGLIYLFYRTPAVAKAYGVSNPSLIGGALLALVGTNGVPEAIVSTIVTPIISIPLLHFMNKK